MKACQKDIYLAGGCFWGIEAYFQKIHGVMKTEVGYANGKDDCTSYRLLKETGHAETVHLVYDENRISLAAILSHFFRIIDPVSVNRQGNDRGTQYRTGIYYIDAFSYRIAKCALEQLQKNYGSPLAIELEPLRHFVPAEPEHQNYLENNPAGYCHIALSMADVPLASEERYGKMSPEELKDLPELSYRVTQESATEMPGTSQFIHPQKEGIYVDITSGAPLFSTEDQFDSGCGWPSFTKPMDPGQMVYREDYSHRMQRTEVRSRNADAHLGHVFEDGPAEKGGLRFCINGAALRFIPKEKMEEEGYGMYLPYLEK